MTRKPEWTPTIEEIRAYMRENWDEGVACPCCSQKVKLYRRRVNRGMAEVLVALAQETLRRRMDEKHRPYINVERDLIYGCEQLQGARDWQTMRFWELIEPLADGLSRKQAGEWRITPLGLWVVEHPKRELLHEYVEVFNNRARGRSEKKRTLCDALQRPFAWEDIASRAA